MLVGVVSADLGPQVTVGSRLGRRISSVQPSCPANHDARCMPASQLLEKIAIAKITPTLTLSEPSGQEPGAGTADILGDLIAQTADPRRAELDVLGAVTVARTVQPPCQCQVWLVCR